MAGIHLSLKLRGKLTEITAFHLGQFLHSQPPILLLRINAMIQQPHITSLTPLFPDRFRNRIRRAPGYKISGSLLIPMRQMALGDRQACTGIEKSKRHGKSSVKWSALSECGLELRKTALRECSPRRSSYSYLTAAHTISSTRFSEAAPLPSINAFPGIGCQLSRSCFCSGCGIRVSVGSY